MIIFSDYNLPNPVIDIGQSVSVAVTRTKMDSGKTKQRKRFTQTIRTIQLTWEFNDLEYKIFQAVFEHKLNQGADWFELVLPLGNGFQTAQVRFVNSWSAKHYGVLNWKVSATVETELGSVMSESELDLLFP